MMMVRQSDILLATTWFSLTTAYFLFGDDLVQLEPIYFYHLLAFVVTFAVYYRAVGLLLASIGNKPLKRCIPAKLIYGIALVLACIILVRLGMLLLSVGFANAMEFRLAVSGRGEAPVSLGIGFTFPWLLAAYYLARTRGDEILGIIFFALSLLVATISTSKLFLILVVFYALALSSREHFIRKLSVALVLLLVIFGLTHFLLQKYTVTPEIGLFPALVVTLRVYIFGGIAALQVLLSEGTALHPHVMFTNLVNSLSIAVDVPESTVLPWVSIGDWNTNVYTAFGYWYAWLGNYFSMIMGAGLGAFVGVFNSKNRLITQFFLFYAVFLNFALFFTVFGDHFLAAAWMHVGFIFCSVALGLVKKETRGVLLNWSLR